MPPAPWPRIRNAWFHVKKRLPIGPPLETESPIESLAGSALQGSWHSITAFDGTPSAWAHYLSTPASERHQRPWQIGLDVTAQDGRLRFSPEGQGHADTIEPLIDVLNVGWQQLRTALANKPHVLQTLDQLVRHNPSNQGGLWLQTSKQLPSQATREIDRLHARSDQPRPVLVLQHRLVKKTIRQWQALPDNATDARRLGVACLLWVPLLHSLGYPNQPRDRFVERIDITHRVANVFINALHRERHLGQLTTNAAGHAHTQALAELHQLSEAELQATNPTLCLWQDLASMLSDHPNPLVEDNAKIIVRAHLDERYLRLSVAELLPPIPSSRIGMPLSRIGDHTHTPRPELGRYGIVDKEDLDAWKKVARAFDKQGFPLVRQLGIGQFGRVYEAVNLLNGNLPRRVAIKVDRLTRRGRNPIQDPTHAMAHANKLAMSPHIIRLYDTGHLPRLGLNYHILQLLDGETLDDLLGITGREHASIKVPNPNRSAKALENEVRFSLSVAHGETWRIRGEQTAFANALRLGQVNDLLTSIFLWIEEIHGLGYAINDLKNGNLMLTRSGQLKGIDLDTYAPAFHPSHRMVDFKFLAVSIVLFLLNAGHSDRVVPVLTGGLLSDPDATAELVKQHWHFGDVGELSQNRVGTDQMVAMLVDLITGCNDNTFAHDTAAFTQTLNQFLQLKRRVSLDEVVLD